VRDVLVGLDGSHIGAVEVGDDFRGREGCICVDLEGRDAAAAVVRNGEELVLAIELRGDGTAGLDGLAGRVG